MTYADGCQRMLTDADYRAECDNARNKYGRPMREGAFPDDPMVVEWRLHTRHMNEHINASIAADIYLKKNYSHDLVWPVWNRRASAAAVASVKPQPVAAAGMCPHEAQCEDAL